MCLCISVTILLSILYYIHIYTIYKAGKGFYLYPKDAKKGAKKQLNPEGQYTITNNTISVLICWIIFVVICCMYAYYSYMYILIYYVCIYEHLLYVYIYSIFIHLLVYMYNLSVYVYTAVALLKSLRETEGWSVASKLSTEDIQMRLISRFVNEVTICIHTFCSAVSTTTLYAHK